MLALASGIAGQESNHDTSVSVKSPLVGWLLTTPGQGFTIRIAVEIHVAAQGVVHQSVPFIISVGSCLSKIGNRGHDKTRVDCLQGLIIQTQIGHDAWLKVLNQDVRIPDQILYDSHTGQVLQVKGDAFFVRIHPEKKRTALRVR